MYTELSELKQIPIGKVKSDSVYSVYFDTIGRVDDTPIYLLDKLDVGDVVEGPGMIIDDTQTIVIIPGSKAVLTRKHLYITLD